MQTYSLSHVLDAELLRDLARLVGQDRATTATLLAHIAEVDARRLFVPQGYPSMHAYCVDELRLSEDAAKRRIQAARAARQFPVIFHAVAEGRLHLTGVCLIAPHLNMENSWKLIEAASNKRKIEIEELLARHFQLPDGRVRPITPVPSEIQQPISGQSGEGTAPEGSTLGEGALAHLPELQSVVRPAAAERYLLQVILAKSTHEKLRHAQGLLSHAVPTGDVAQVIDRALDTLIVKIEKRKFGGVTSGPTRQRTTAVSKRYVPAHIRRAVWERDQGQCTFLGANGHRCHARRFLEFDHVDPVARGGKATADGIRLRCRAHNQYEAERAFGTRFMDRKRHEARLVAKEARMRAAAKLRAAQEQAASERAVRDQTRDVIAGLRCLGCRADEARRAAQLSEALQGVTLEERMRAALKSLARRPAQALVNPSATLRSGV